MSGYLKLPRGWTRERPGGPWPFTTRETLRTPDGGRVRWESRAHRKTSAGSGPSGREWWMAGLFSIGSLCFALGGIASQWSIGVTEHQAGIVFFVGSLFFTTAAYLQYSEAVNAERGIDRRGRESAWRPASWEPRRIDWLATLVQLIGTVLFNISTFLALERHLTAGQADLRVWAPDIFGSVAFLVSSQLAFAETCHRWVCLKSRSLSWRIVAVNLLGSCAFGASAIASLVEPSTHAPVSASVSNAGTYLGGFMFLLGAVLLVPEARRHRATRAAQRVDVARAGTAGRPPAPGPSWETAG